jgi:hypothetical protein
MVADIDHGWAALEARVKRMPARANVVVGVLGPAADAPHPTAGEGKGPPPTVLEVAIWNEFGTEHIPARSFIRETLDIHADAILTLARRLAKAVELGRMDEKQAMGLLGEHVVGLMKERIANHGAPAAFAPNAPRTIAKKGSSTPLIAHTGQLRNSITYRIEGA